MKEKYPNLFMYVYIWKQRTRYHNHKFKYSWVNWTSCCFHLISAISFSFSAIRSCFKSPSRRIRRSRNGESCKKYSFSNFIRHLTWIHDSFNVVSFIKFSFNGPQFQQCFFLYLLAIAVHNRATVSHTQKSF